MKQLFVIMPFGVKNIADERATTSIDFDSVYRDIIKPSGIEAGFRVRRIDEVAKSETVNQEYLKEIFEADVVVADISLPNANVYYELGIRHAISTGRTFLMALEGTLIPFDLGNQQVYFYTLTRDANEKSRRVLTEALAEQNFHNPVRAFLEEIGAIASPISDFAGFEIELLGRIQRAQNREQLIAVWHWAKNLSPLPPFTLLPLARRLSDHGEWTHSVDVLKVAVDQRPNDFELLRELGWHLSKLGEHEEASLKTLGEALSLNPSDPETLGMIAGVLKRKGLYDEARKYYARGAAISPNNLYMLVNQAAMQLFSSPQNPAEGIALYELIRKKISQDQHPLDEWGEVVLGEASFVLDDLQAARGHFLAANKLASSPKSLRSAADQIALLGMAGYRPKEARETAEWIRSIANEALEQIEVLEVYDVDHPPTMRRFPVLLHLSDIHFGGMIGTDGQPKEMHRFRDGDYSQRLSRHLVSEFSSRRAHFNHDPDQLYLLISGDLTYSAEKSEFDSTGIFLHEVCEGLRISKERVFIVPGNHDVNWKLARTDLSHRFDNYIEFLISFYGERLFRQRHPIFDWNLKFNSKRPDPWQLLSFHHDSATGLTILGFNSCVYETDQDHYGFIGGRQLNAGRELLDDVARPNQGVKVAVFHHHLHPFPEAIELDERAQIWADLSIVRDSGIIERQLERLNFDLILHGHKHKAQIRETTIMNVDCDNAKLIVCGAGSVGVNASELAHNVSNQYQVVEILRNPRKRGVDFLRVEWRTLDLSPEAEWVTPGSWIISG